MTNIKFLLLIGTSLSLIPTITFAQCVATQDCETLGYTETSCNGGKGVKCPFGNKWACFKTDSECEQQFCDKYGFQYTCTGTGYSGGSGTACNGKYTACNCAQNYEWKDGICKEKTPDYTNCAIGTLFYSDNTCSTNLITGKTLLGVVIMEKTVSDNGWIMTVSPIATDIIWGASGTYKSGIKYCVSESCLTDIQASCSNTDVITAYGNSSKFPAAWTAKNYHPEGTPEGKSWCLPSGGLLKNINNADNFAKINQAITTAGGKKIGFGTSSSYERVWASSEVSSLEAWVFFAYEGGSFGMATASKDNTYAPSVRAVMAF